MSGRPVGKDRYMPTHLKINLKVDEVLILAYTFLEMYKQGLTPERYRLHEHRLDQLYEKIMRYLYGNPNKPEDHNDLMYDWLELRRIQKEKLAVLAARREARENARQDSKG